MSGQAEVQGSDWPSWLKPHPPRPRPQRIRVFFCSVCGFSTGIEDYDRIRHEHFENDRRCANGVWDIRTYELVESADQLRKEGT